MNKYFNIFVSMMALIFSTVSMAAAPDHSAMGHKPAAKAPMDHSKMKQHRARAKTKGRLRTLKRIPKSGRAREAGSDGRYAMESSSSSDGLRKRCAQASRGLIVLDNATWKRCGGKPAGAAGGAAKAKAIDHSKMGH